MAPMIWLEIQAEEMHSCSKSSGTSSSGSQLGKANFLPDRSSLETNILPDWYNVWDIRLYLITSELCDPSDNMYRWFALYKDISLSHDCYCNNRAITGKNNKHNYPSFKILFRAIWKFCIVNCGSSSTKSKLFVLFSKVITTQGGVEKSVLKGSPVLNWLLPDMLWKILEKHFRNMTRLVWSSFWTIDDISPECRLSNHWTISTLGRIFGGKRYK